MGKLVFSSPTVTIGATDLSSSVRAVSIDYSAEVVDSTTAGVSTKTKKGGLLDWSATVEFAQDYDAGSVNAILFPLVGTSVAVSVIPASGGASATNPDFNGAAILTAYKPAGGSIGGLAVATATFAGNGALARDES